MGRVIKSICLYIIFPGHNTIFNSTLYFRYWSYHFCCFKLITYWCLLCALSIIHAQMFIQNHHLRPEFLPRHPEFHLSVAQLLMSAPYRLGMQC